MLMNNVYGNDVNFVSNSSTQLNISNNNNQVVVDDIQKIVGFDSAQRATTQTEVRKTFSIKTKIVDETKKFPIQSGESTVVCHPLNDVENNSERALQKRLRAISVYGKLMRKYNANKQNGPSIRITSFPKHSPKLGYHLEFPFEINESTKPSGEGYVKIVQSRFPVSNVSSLLQTSSLVTSHCDVLTVNSSKPVDCKTFPIQVVEEEPASNMSHASSLLRSLRKHLNDISVYEMHIRKYKTKKQNCLTIRGPFISFPIQSSKFGVHFEFPVDINELKNPTSKIDAKLSQNGFPVSKLAPTNGSIILETFALEYVDCIDFNVNSSLIPISLTQNNSIEPRHSSILALDSKKHTQRASLTSHTNPPEIHRHFSNSPTDFYQNNVEISIDEHKNNTNDHATASYKFMTQSENSNTKYEHFGKIQVQTKKENISTANANDQRKSLLLKCVEQQQQNMVNDDVLLPAANIINTINEQQSINEANEHHNSDNIDREINRNCLLSGKEKHIYNEQLGTVDEIPKPQQQKITPPMSKILKEKEADSCVEQKLQIQHISNTLPNTIATTVFDNDLGHQSSDERDTSSQEVLLVAVNRTSETRPTALSSHQKNSTELELLPTKNKNYIKTPQSEKVVKECIKGNDADGLSDLINHSQKENLNDPPETRIRSNCKQSEDSEMTVTKIEDSEEEEHLSAASSILSSDNQKNFSDTIDEEMKFEMKNVKGALPSATVRTHLRNEHNLPSSVAVRSSVAVAVGHNYSSVVDGGAYSAGLPRFGKAGEVLSTVRPLNEVSRTVSVDTMDSVLPSRTRLRRQRRTLSQDLEDQPEDPIERLNRLRARISGALSEVKGVLKHYSTDQEGEGQAPDPLPIVAKKIDPPKKEEELAPVQFRFVRKVRRRSIFNEEDEDMEKKMEEVKREFNSKNDSNKDKEEEENNKLLKHLKDLTFKETGQINEKLKKQEVLEGIKEKNKSKLCEEIRETENVATTQATEVEPVPAIEVVQIEKPVEKPIISISTGELKDVQPKEENEDGKPLDELKEVPETSTETNTEDINLVNEKCEVAVAAAAKPKKRLTKTTATKDSIRRASIAAVEGSRIVPPIKATIPLAIKTQRRPSDSEAIVKKKVTTATTEKTTSFVEEELKGLKVMSKKIVKVKRPSVKSTSHAKTSASAIEAETTSANDNEIKSGATATTTSTTSIVKAGSDTITEAINSHKATCEVEAVSAASATTTTTTEIAANTLPTQLLIDYASLTISEEATTATISKTNETTKDSRSATKLDEQNDAMVATLVSPLRASDQSSQAKNATQLKEFVDETIVVVPTATITSTGDPIRKADKEIKFTQTPAGSNCELEQFKSVDSEKANKNISNNISETKIISADAAAELPKISETVSAPATSQDIKEPINHKIIPADLLNKQQQQQVQQPNQQVTTAVPAVPVAAVVKKSLNAANKTDETTSKIPPNDAIRVDEATKASSTPTVSISIAEHTTGATSESTTETNTQAEANMPELQVLPAPVKAGHVFVEPAPFNVPKESDFAKKKVILKKIVRKISAEKSAQTTITKKHDEINTQATATKDKSKVTEPSQTSNEISIEDVTALTGTSNEIVEEGAAVEEIPAPIEEPPAPPKKPRKVKKKVIIKRQHRKLSISENTFFKEPAEELPVTSEDVETLEKAIAYVTDDEAEEEPVEPPKPLKTCIRQREYQEGDWVMYAERYKKTLVRWKKGRVLDRITSISYKLEIEGKEVPAHISYIKKHTDRKVNFGGKEYLEIDYEQVAQEEVKARSYSIWNMV